MALGAFFSAAEVIPLTLLTVEAWSFLQLGTRQQVGGGGGVPAPLGGAVPGLGRVLELPGGRGLRLPDQPAGRQLLRDRHAADLQPRPRGLHGGLRHARPGAAGLLHALPGPARGLERAAGAVLVLGDQRRADADDPRAPVPAGGPAARRRGDQRLLARADGVVPELPVAVVGADAGRRDLHGRLGPAGLADPEGRAADAADPGPGGPDGESPSRPRCTPRSRRPGPPPRAESGATGTIDGRAYRRCCRR